jgi:hypothetical protein
MPKSANNSVGIAPPGNLDPPSPPGILERSSILVSGKNPESDHPEWANLSKKLYSKEFDIKMSHMIKDAELDMINKENELKYSTYLMSGAASTDSFSLAERMFKIYSDVSKRFYYDKTINDKKLAENLKEWRELRDKYMIMKNKNPFEAPSDKLVKMIEKFGDNSSSEPNLPKNQARAAATPYGGGKSRKQRAKKSRGVSRRR